MSKRADILSSLRADVLFLLLILRVMAEALRLIDFPSLGQNTPVTEEKIFLLIEWWFHSLIFSPLVWGLWPGRQSWYSK